MKKYRGITALLGFALLAIGLIAIVLTLVGIKLAFLLWMDKLPVPFGFLSKIIMMLAGFVILYLALMDPEKEDY